MKLEGLNTQLTNFKNIGLQEVRPGEEARALTLKDVLITVLTGFESASVPEEYVQAYELGCQLEKATDFIEVSESDIRLLEKAVVEKRIWTALVIGQVLTLLKKVTSEVPQNA